METDVKIVGLTGLAGVGKDTVADIMVEHYGYIKLSLADPIKNGLAAMFGIDPKLMYEQEFKEAQALCGDKTWRQLQQTLGTEWGRNVVSKDFWVDLLDRRIHLSGHNKFVVPDVRFDNEALFIRVRDGHVIEITREGAGCKGGIPEHASESGINPRYVIAELRNNGTLDYLRLQVRTMHKAGII